jgi:hypothetical protein
MTAMTVVIVSRWNEKSRQKSPRHNPSRAHQVASWLDSGLSVAAGRADLTALEIKPSQAVANVCCSRVTVSKRLAAHSAQTIVTSVGFLALSSRFPKSDSICRIARKRSIHERCMSASARTTPHWSVSFPAFATYLAVSFKRANQRNDRIVASDNLPVVLRSPMHKLHEPYEKGSSKHSKINM